eukprot:3941048-Rhodomonas_salina.1
MARHRVGQQCCTLEDTQPGRVRLCIARSRSMVHGRSIRPPSCQLPKSTQSCRSQTGRMPVVGGLGLERMKQGSRVSLVEARF